MMKIYKKGVRTRGHSITKHFAFVIRFEPKKISRKQATDIVRWCSENLGTYPTHWLFNATDGVAHVHTVENATLFKLRWEAEL